MMVMMMMMMRNNKQARKWEENGDSNESILLFCSNMKAVITRPVCDCNYE
jgi:hypothetical protein